MTVKITPNDKGNPAGKLADAEVHFTNGPLEGLKLIGFAIWERRSRPCTIADAFFTPGSLAPVRESVYEGRDLYQDKTVRVENKLYGPGQAEAIRKNILDAQPEGRLKKLFEFRGTNQERTRMISELLLGRGEERVERDQITLRLPLPTTIVFPRGTTKRRALEMIVERSGRAGLTPTRKNCRPSPPLRTFRKRKSLFPKACLSVSFLKRKPWRFVNLSTCPKS